MHPRDNCIEEVVESMTVEQIMELLTRKMADAGLFEDEHEEFLAVMDEEARFEDDADECASLRQSLLFLPIVLQNVCGADTVPLLKRMLESPIDQTAAYVKHVLGNFKSEWCSGMVIDDGLNTPWEHYMDGTR